MKKLILLLFAFSIAPLVIPIPHCYPCGKEIPMPNPHSPNRPTLK